MSKKRLIYTALACLTLGGLGCAAHGPEGASETDETSAALTSASCPGLRWVGLASPSGVCPPAEGWSVDRLITDATAPASLRSFCTYEWMGAPAAFGPLPQQTRKKLERVDRDCAVVSGLAPALSPASAMVKTFKPVLEGSHRRQVETLPAPIAGNTPVEISVIDSWASPTVEGRSVHGFAMAGIIEGLACDPNNLSFLGACPVRTVPRLALDRHGPHAERDTVNGGTYGYQSMIASALYDAVKSPTAARKLVNLSVAWPPEYNASSTNPGVLSNAVEAVRRALEVAACNDVLVIAAAGNDSGGPTPGVGPMMPARWQTVAATCAGGGSRPLLYSASGVTGTDAPLPNAREGAHAQLVAPSFAVPATKLLNGVEVTRGPFTGSSVSAAVVSATAALVWQANGTLAPEAVMQRVTSSAVALDTDADYCLAAPCGKNRRVSLCRAVASAGGAVSCTGVEIKKHAGVNPAYTSATLDTARKVPHTKASTGALASLNVNGCTLPIFSSGSTETRRTACPSTILPTYLDDPSVDPMPGSDPCPACTVQIDPSTIWVDMPINDLLPPGSSVLPQTFDFTVDGEIVETYDLGGATDSLGDALDTGVTAGAVYQVALPLPLTSVFFTGAVSGATIRWTTPSTYKASHLVVSPP